MIQMLSQTMVNAMRSKNAVPELQFQGDKLAGEKYTWGLLVPLQISKSGGPDDVYQMYGANAADRLLLCDPVLASLVDFDRFFFLTGHLSIGGALAVPTAEGVDNITAADAAFHVARSARLPHSGGTVGGRSRAEEQLFGQNQPLG